MPDSVLRIGSKLLKARRAQKIKIKRVAEDLCIRKDFLQAFEKNDLSVFDNRTYAVGFVRAYADYLNLDPEPIVEEVKGAVAPEPLNVKSLPQQEAAERNWLPVAAVALFIGLVASALFLGWQYFKNDATRTSAVPEVPSHLASLLYETPKVKPERPVSLLANGGNDYFRDMVRRQGGEEALQTVRVLAIDEVKVAIRGEDGVVAREGMMYPGESLILPLNAGLEILTPDPAGLSFYFDDQKAGINPVANQGLFMVSLDQLEASPDQPVPAS